MLSYKVLLLVNCFNSDRYLPETLKSLSELEYDNYEVLVFDNCSTDSTASIAKKFSHEFANFKYFKLPFFVNLVKARTYALKYITQLDFDYFGFCDSDDLWSKNWLSTLTSSPLNHDLLFSNGYELIHSNNQETSLIPVSSSLACNKCDTFSSKLYLGSALFSSKLLDSSTEFLDNSLPYHYDIELFLRLSTQNITYIHYSDHLFNYRIHSFSLTSKLYFATLRERWKITKKMELPISLFILKFIYFYLLTPKFYYRLLTLFVSQLRKKI